MLRKHILPKKYLRALLFLGVIISLIDLQMAVFAQTGTVSWSSPENLSNSGGATTPNLVVDTGGSIHVIWEDEFDGSIYSRYDGQQWSEPLAVTFPFQGCATDVGAGARRADPCILAQ